MAKKTAVTTNNTQNEKRLHNAEELFDTIKEADAKKPDGDDDEPEPEPGECDDFWDFLDDDDFGEDDPDPDDADFEDSVLTADTEPVAEASVKEEIPFYDGRYTPYKKHVDVNNETEVDLNNPVSIFNYLKSRVYKQDKYCRDAAMILYNHINGKTSANLVCGPAGCGKTHVWECLNEIYPKIIIVNAATLSKDGWKGENKVTSFLSLVDFQEPDYIIVFDEFDKCAAPQHSSGGENTSAGIQSEFLKLVEGCLVPTKRDGIGEMKIDTSPMSFVFCGSFAIKAGEIAESRSSNGFGFGAQKREVRAFSSELSIKDVIDFGVIHELASRIIRMTNVRPLTLEDYCYLLTKHPASPVKKIEEQYGIKLRLSKKKCEEIGQKAFESGLGIRNATAQLQQIVDDRIFEGFSKEVNAHVL